MKKPDINQFAATLFRNYEPGENDDIFYSDRFKNYLDGFEKRKQTTPTVTDRQFKESERVIMRRLLESDDLDSINTRSALRYRDHLKNRKDGILATNKKIHRPVPPDSLVSLFDSTSKYQEVMKILEGKELLYPNNYWKDTRTGCKTFLAALIKDLKFKGYYKDNKGPTADQIVAICKNTFGINISKGTVDRAKASDKDLGIIPFATTID